MKAFLTLLFTILICGCFAATQFHYKHNAGPPSGFKSMESPNPIKASSHEQSETHYFHFEPKDSKLIYSKEFYVDAKSFSFVLAIPIDYQVTFTDPQQNQINLENYKREASLPIGLKSVPATEYLFVETNLSMGKYMISIESSESFPAKNILDILQNPAPDGFISLWTDNEVEIDVFIQSYQTTLNSQVGTNAFLTEEDPRMISKKTFLAELPEVSSCDVLEATMTVTFPDWSTVTVPLHDDGKHGDFEEGDHIYGATVKALQEGTYVIETYIKGKHPDTGLIFTRSSEKLIAVLADDVDLSGTAQVKSDGSEVVEILLDIEKYDNALSEFIAYAEVYGTTKSGDVVPVAWLSGITQPTQTASGSYVLPMQLNLHWLNLVGASEPLYLHNVDIQDVNNYIDLDLVNEIPVKTDGIIDDLLEQLSLETTEVTLEMRQGKMPEEFLESRQSEPAFDLDLIMIHGYCASSNPWPKDDFDNAVYFQATELNISNDVFAKQIFEASKLDTDGSFSVVGHSQGGMASLHLYTYYFSGLDMGQQLPTTIQTLGTPWYGCNAAGSLASLGSVFGVGCGSNYDLSRDGAIKWITSIPADKRPFTSSYTTTYKLGNFFGDYCSLPMNLVLEYPNDGTCELDFAVLEGGNYQGNTQKECHTTSMGYPAQYLNAARNKAINDLAAR